MLESLLPSISLDGLGVVPVLIGPLQVFLMFLPAIALAVGGVLLRLLSPKTFWNILKLLWRFKYQVLGIGVVLFGLWWFKDSLRFGHQTTAAKAETGSSDWACLGGNTARSGASPDSPAPNTPEILWSSMTNGMRESCVMSSPAVVGNRVYVATARVAFGGGDGAIYAFDADTGKLAWDLRPKGYRPTFSSPTVSGKYLAIGEGLHVCSDARVFVLDISGEKPVEKWSFRTKNHVESSPAIADGRIFVGAGDDGYYGFDIEKGPTPIWHLEGDKYRDCETSPVVVNGKVYFGLGMEGHAVVCVDAATGKEEWRVDTPAPVFTAPTIFKDCLYVGMGYGDYINSAEHSRDAEREKMQKHGKTAEEIAAFQKEFSVQGAIWCIELAPPHKIRWKTATPKAVLNAVSCDENGLMAASVDGSVLSLGFDGRVLASFKVGSAAKTSVALCQDLAYVVSDVGRLFALERDNLKIRFEAKLGAQGEGFYFSSPAISRGHIYVGTDSDGLLCVGRPVKQSPPTIWSGEHGGPGCGGSLRLEAAAKQGEMLWNLPEGQQPADNGKASKDAIVLTASPALVEEDLLTPISGPNRTGLSCQAFVPAVKTLPKERWFHSATNPIVRSPLVSGTRVLILDGTSGQDARVLTALDRSSGHVLWKTKVDRQVAGWISANEKEILAELMPGTLSALALSDGKILWQGKLPESLSVEPSAVGALIVVATSKKLLLLDRQSGTTLWTVELSQTPSTAPLLQGRRIVIGTNLGLQSYSALDGSPSTDWKAPKDHVAGNAFVATARFFAYASSKELVVLDPANGQEIARHTALPCAPVRFRGSIFFVSPRGLERLDETDPKQTPILWSDTTWLGTPSTALISAGDGVIGGFGGWGLVRLGGSK